MKNKIVMKCKKHGELTINLCYVCYQCAKCNILRRAKTNWKKYKSQVREKQRSYVDNLSDVYIKQLLKAKNKPLTQKNIMKKRKELLEKRKIWG